MIDLKSLARAIAKDRRENGRERRYECAIYEDHLTITPDDFKDDFDFLPESLKWQVDELKAMVREVIPDDIGFNLNFHDHGVGISFEYDDGTAGSWGGEEKIYYRYNKLFEALKLKDWDEFRSASLQSMDIFDVMLEEAEDRPVNIPSSEAAAKRYAQDLSAEVAKILQGYQQYSFILIIARDDLGLASQHLPTREEVVFTIADRMTTQNDILAVIEKGVPWSFDAIEAAKLEAVEGLSPISRTKAERRFGL